MGVKRYLVEYKINISILAFDLINYWLNNCRFKQVQNTFIAKHTEATLHSIVIELAVDELSHLYSDGLNIITYSNSKTELCLQMIQAISTTCTDNKMLKFWEQRKVDILHNLTIKTSMARLHTFQNHYVNTAISFTKLWLLCI